MVLITQISFDYTDYTNFLFTNLIDYTDYTNFFFTNLIDYTDYTNFFFTNLIDYTDYTNFLFTNLIDYTDYTNFFFTDLIDFTDYTNFLFTNCTDRTDFFTTASPLQHNTPFTKQGHNHAPPAHQHIIKSAHHPISTSINSPPVFPATVPVLWPAARR
jgi:hypothetical protein